MAEWLELPDQLPCMRLVVAIGQPSWTKGLAGLVTKHHPFCPEEHGVRDRDRGASLTSPDREPLELCGT